MPICTIRSHTCQLCLVIYQRNIFTFNNKPRPFFNEMASVPSNSVISNSATTKYTGIPFFSSQTSTISFSLPVFLVWLPPESIAMNCLLVMIATTFSRVASAMYEFLSCANSSNSILQQDYVKICSRNNIQIIEDYFCHNFSSNLFPRMSEAVVCRCSS